jgi:acyl-CoA reductase-like NAD-dependent aldehyde dehydrogenase
MGVLGIIAEQSTSLTGLVSLVLPAICGGNTSVVLASENLPLCAVTFAEVLNSSDLPGGVVNILTGSVSEMAPTLASHMDVNAIVVSHLEDTLKKSLSVAAVDNLKRKYEFTTDWNKADAQGLHYIADLQEIKTTWHPIENIGGATSSY